jgi:hypothetical protein
MLTQEGELPEGKAIWQLENFLCNYIKEGFPGIK